MSTTYRWLFAGCLGVALLLPAGSGLGRNSDGKLGMLWRPASTHPVIRLRGKTFPIISKAASSAKNWKAWLVPPHSSWKQIPLTLSAAHDSKNKQWKLTAKIPATTPEELYGLRVSHAGGSDTNKIAVKVLKAYPTSYYVAHYTDTQNTAVLAGHSSKALKTIIAELNVIQPELSINTGDLVTYGNAWPQGNNEYKNFIADLEQARIASYHIPGNHDIYHMRCWDRKNFQAQYEQYIGERNYSFTFGAQHFTGFELSGYTWMCPHATLTSSQVAWITADLKAAVAAGAKPLMLFAHQLEYNVKLDKSDLYKLCNSHTVPLYLYGHIHSDALTISGKAPTHYISTDNAGASRYRLVDISGGKVLTYGYAGTAKNSITAGNVKSSFSPASDGKSKDVTATVQNGLAQTLKYIKLTFVMAAPPAGAVYQVQGGSKYQEVHIKGGPSYIYVRGVVAKAKTSAKVRVWIPPQPDMGVPDAGTPDVGLPDSATPDAGMPDALAADSTVKPDSKGPDAPAGDLAADLGSSDGPVAEATPGPDSGVPDSPAGDSAADLLAETGVKPDSSAGPDVGDAAFVADSGQTVTSEGCSCRMQGQPPEGGGLLLMMLLSLLVIRRWRAPPP